MSQSSSIGLSTDKKKKRRRDDDAKISPQEENRIFQNILNDLSKDPNEPKYCTCKRVSYGDMVACENPDCPIEWFHFRCVGLTTVVSYLILLSQLI